MNKIFIFIIIGVVLVGGFFLLQGYSAPSVPEAPEAEEAMEDSGAMMEDEAMEGADQAMLEEEIPGVIVYTDSGYSPSEITIQAGDTVTFLNESSAENWPASAMHPEHTVYPGSGIDKCGTDEVIFDACGSLSTGAEWSFTFTEVGEWGFHNHRMPGHWGRIIVE